MPAYLIPNLINAGRVLKLLAAKPGQTVLQISRVLNVPRTSVLRIVTSLVREGLLDADGTAYTLGPALIYLGVRAMDGIDLTGLAQPLLKRLSMATGETAHLAMLADDASLLLEVCQSPLPIRAGAPAGTRADLHCSARERSSCRGTTSISWTTFSRGCSRRPHGPDDHFGRKDAQEIALILKRGYAVDEEEFFDGIRCIAVPVPDSRGRVTLALGVTGVTTRFTRARIPECAVQLKTAAAELSAALGYRPDTKCGASSPPVA
jgi:IclR family acetate operon transcriptional repressor